MEVDYDFDASLRLTEVAEDFFYSTSTGLYVFRHPVIVDDRVRGAADTLGIKVLASPEKWLVNTRLDDCLRILYRLDSTALSLPEYFQVRKEAMTKGDSDMLSSLESDQFIEMLSTIFVKDKHLINHPTPVDGSQFAGELIPVQTPVGRYGWIDPEDMDETTGLPKKVSYTRNLEDCTIKYWDSHTAIGENGKLMAVRGYVTSVGKISLDLGFPYDAISRKLTIRECRKSLPTTMLEAEILEEAKTVLPNYYQWVSNKSSYKGKPAWFTGLASFVEKNKFNLRASKDTAGSVLKEDIYDAFGILSSYAVINKEWVFEEQIKSTSKLLFDRQEITDNDFQSFLQSRKARLVLALENHESITFVIGHKNPDTDTVISAAAEAFRQHLLACGRQTYVPVVDGTIPKEVNALMGHNLASCLIQTDFPEYAEAVQRDTTEWIMVDHNIGPEQPNTKQIIDHHYPSEVCLRQRIPRKVVFAGSTTALVAQKIYGLGVEIPGEMAKIMQGACLMDTENRFPGKMTGLDEIVMDRLQLSSGVKDESELYQGLMAQLVSCYKPEILFNRDYKEDWDYFGIAVAKGIGLLDERHSGVIQELQNLAAKNNMSKNLPLTLVKVVDYDKNAETIRKERIYTVFNKSAQGRFREAVKNTIITVINHESPKEVHIRLLDNAIEYFGSGTQLSRKKLAPVLEIVAKAFNQYFYSPSTGLYLKRDFLRKNDKLARIAEKNKITIHASEDGTLVGNPAALKFLLQETGLLCATPSQYFKAYFDAIKAKDVKMVAHLTSSKYLETLDAIVESMTTLIEGAKMTVRDGCFSYKGGIRRQVDIPKGEPGLIDPEKIDMTTGLPTIVEDPQQYEKNLWR